MAKKVINIGLAANDGTGDSLRIAGGKINDNFTEVYDALSTAYSYTLPKASASVLGGVKVGANLSMNASTGVLSASVPNDLTDLNIVDGSDGQYLKTDGAGNFAFAPLSSQVGNLNDLGDVVLSSPSNGQVLKYNGTQWINGTDAGQSGNPFDQELNTTDQVEFVSTTADEYILGGSGTPTLESETDVFISAVGKVEIISKSPFRLANMTTSERNALTNVENGDVIYNTTTNKFQGRANGAWVDLH